MSPMSGSPAAGSVELAQTLAELEPHPRQTARRAGSRQEGCDLPQPSLAGLLATFTGDMALAVGLVVSTVAAFHPQTAFSMPVS